MINPMPMPLRKKAIKFIDQTQKEVADMNERNAGSLTQYDRKGRVDADKTLANITRKDFADYERDIKPIEMELLEKAKTDTSLIDRAKEDAARAPEMMRGIAQRNAERYGAYLTPAQRAEQERALERGTTLGGIQAVNDARIEQKDANRSLMADLINIGQGVNRSSLGQLGSAAANAAQRENAYSAAKAQHKANTYSMLGSLGAAAIFAFF